MSEPIDKELYKKVKRMVKKRSKVWPSAYASGQLVQEYKRRGGRYRGKKKSFSGKRTTKRKTTSKSSKRKQKRCPKGTRRSGKVCKKISTKRQRGGSLDRWFKEDWRNVCKKTPSGQYAKCGRKKASLKGKSYPYCRPLRRVNKNTPKSIGEMSKSEIRKMCNKKQRSMKKSKGKQTRVYVGKNKRKSSRSYKRGGGYYKKGGFPYHYNKQDGGSKSLPSGTKFVKGSGRYKYTAIMPDGKRVHFGHRDYQHYKDSVPKRLGGGLWSHKDHGDKKRRENYRKRHGGVKTKSGGKAINKKYSPSWFSYHFLW
jgi:hypothetical protein